MTRLAKRDTELVALGAAVASNCVPCVVFHIREARDCGLTDLEIKNAVQYATMVRQVPANLVLNAAHQELTGVPSEAPEEAPATGGCGCQAQA